MRSLFLTSFLVLVSQTLTLASEQRFEYGHLVTEADTGELTCFMVSQSGQTLDLNRICQGLPARQGVNYFVLPSQGGSSSSVARDNRCVNDNDRAADGSRCGDRSSFSRQGGR